MKRTIEMKNAGVPSAKPGAMIGQVPQNRYGLFLKSKYRTAYRPGVAHVDAAPEPALMVAVPDQVRVRWWLRFWRWLKRADWIGLGI
jgi:hypothetical protein